MISGGNASNEASNKDNLQRQEKIGNFNVQVVSWRVNHLKSDGTPEEWDKIAKWCKQEDKT